MEKLYQIPGYQYYGISETGNVFSNLTGKFVKQHENNGYQMVFLMSPVFNGYTKKGKWAYVHRLMGITFLPPPKEKQVWINHKDGNKQNNSILNLEWSTISENILHYWNVLGGRKKKPALSQ